MSAGPDSSDEQTKRVWSLGSYTDIAPHFLPMAAHLVDATGVKPTDAVLDVACGTGNVAITAARRGASVTGLDITPAMLEDARENAAIAGVEDITWQEGNATALPFDDDEFDTTLSCVGHMFAVPAEVTGRELVRVTRPGGQLAFTSWTPTSVVPALGSVLAEYLPPDPDAPDPPYAWGDPDTVRDRLAADVESIAFETGTVWTPVVSPAHFWHAAETQSGLFIMALDAVEAADREAIREESIETIGRFFDDRRNAIEMEYRLATATVR